jgi:hypothetical protein
MRILVFPVGILIYHIFNLTRRLPYDVTDTPGLLAAQLGSAPHEDLP